MGGVWGIPSGGQVAPGSSEGLSLNQQTFHHKILTNITGIYFARTEND